MFNARTFAVLSPQKALKRGDEGIDTLLYDLMRDTENRRETEPPAGFSRFRLFKLEPSDAHAQSDVH